MKALSAHRKHPLAVVVLLLLGLLVTGGAYAAFTASQAAEASSESSQADIESGEALFLANCATCHGVSAQGTDQAPSLAGVGAAAVDFQVGTGRMPMQMQGPQALQKPVQFNEEQTAQLAAYVASLAPGPSVPEERLVEPTGDAARGGELFRVNCAMCHNAVGAGGALTAGKEAPALTNVSGRHIYEAMVTGPQSMPVFNDSNISPQEKQDIITYLYDVREPSPGGLKLGSLGPVAEGLFIWTIGLGVIVALTIWLTSKSS